MQMSVGEVKQQDPAIIADCPGHRVELETVLLMEFSEKLCICLQSDTSQIDKRCSLPRTHVHHQKKRVMKAEETSSSEISDDDYFCLSAIRLYSLSSIRG